MAGAPTESAPAAATPRPALGFAPPLEQPRRPGRRRMPAGVSPSGTGRQWIATVGFAALLCAVTFYAQGGLTLETMTATEIALTIGSGVVLAAAALVLRRGERRWGVWSVGLLFAFALLAAISIVWSVQPDGSWQDANRLLAYAAVFAAAAALVRLAPRHWPAVLGGIVLGAVAVCGYAIVAKSLPGHFTEAHRFARLYEPFGYWNALGLTAAMGAIACLWLGGRRSGHGLLSALAYPAMGVLLLTLLLAYSRGALAALIVGVALWMCAVPLRLRGAAVLLAGGAAAGAIAAWDFSNHALSGENVSIVDSTHAGHELGALVLAMIAVLSVVGIVVGFASGRRAPSARARRRAGASLIALLAVLVLAFAGALAHSHRGLTGSISHALHSLTNTHARVPNTPGRLTAIASVRAQYWDEALKVFKAHPLLGVGAQGYEVARLRYRTGTLPVKHAHGFVVQTLADLGIIGLLLALALLACWLAAAGRATHPFNRRWPSWREVRDGTRPGWRPLSDPAARRYTPERIGLLTMLCIVVTFGVHSLVDWTWYVPGDALVVLVCAGWLAGRGPLRRAPAIAPAQANGRGAAQEGEGEASGRRALSARPGSVRIGVACGVIAAALLLAWSQWEPQRSEDAREQALALLGSDVPAARAAAHTAIDRDPLSIEALTALAEVQSEAGESRLAQHTLRRAVRLQPSNPQTWLTLGRYDLATHPHDALEELRAGIYLDPGLISAEALQPGAPGQQEAVQVYNSYVQALRAVAAAAALRTAAAPRSPAGHAETRAARRRRERRLRRSRSRR